MPKNVRIAQPFTCKEQPQLERFITDLLGVPSNLACIPLCQHPNCLGWAVTLRHGLIQHLARTSNSKKVLTAEAGDSQYGP